MENSPPTNRSKLKKIIQALHSKHDVDEKGQEILNLLEEHGKGIMEKAPEALVEMVGKAHNLIGSSLYTDIVQVMTDICRTHSQSQNELLECLVQQMGDETKMNEFIRHQQNLLSLFRILLVQDDSSDTRTVCVVTLLWNSEFYHSKGFVLTPDFMETVKFMLQGGADPVCLLKDFIHDTPYILSKRTDIDVVSKLLELLPLILTAEIANYQDSYFGTVLHALVSCKWEWLSDVPGHLVQQYEGIIHKVVEANPDLLDMTDYYGQTAVHKLAKAVYDQPDKGCSLLNIFPVLVTQKNVNACDTNSVSPYSWIKAGMKCHKSHQEVFTQIEEIFLKYGADSECATNGLQCLLSMVQNALDHHRKEILELLDEYGCYVVSIQPELFLQIVGRAHNFIGKPIYLEIIQKTVDEYKATPRKPQDGPLQCLVEQMENKDYKGDLWEHQEKLLTLIQILQEADDSSQTMTRCLRTLILHVGWWSERLQWTKELVETLAHLLEGGADPTWIPQDGSAIERVYPYGSALYNFFLEIPHILAHHLCSALILLPRFLTEECLNHREPQGSVLHALVQYDWCYLPENLPGDFFDQYKEIICKVVEASPALLDTTDSYRRSPLQCFILGIINHKELRSNARDISQSLATKTNTSARGKDENAQTVFHILAERYIQIGHEAFLELFSSLKLSSLGDKDGQTVTVARKRSDAYLELCRRLKIPILRDDQDKDQQTVLHILARSCSQMGQKAFLEIFSRLELASLCDIRDTHGQTFLHILAREYPQISSEAFLELVSGLRSFSDFDIQDNNGRTALHILAETLYEHPELGSGLLTVFPVLTPEKNVNCSDRDSNTPFSWILIAKARWGNSETDEKMLSATIDIFLGKGADADLAWGPAVKHLYRWAGQELSDRNCTIDRLQMLLRGMKTMSDGNVLPDRTISADAKSDSNLWQFDHNIWENLWRIMNPKCIPIMMEILRISVTNESTSQHAWDSIMSIMTNSFDVNGVKEIPLSVMEILCLCAERGAQPKDEDMQGILRNTDIVTEKKGLTVQGNITRNEDLTAAFLKTLLAMHKNKHFTCHLQFLGDFYIVPQEILQLGRQLVCAVFSTMDSCLKSSKLIECLLFISHDQKGEKLNSIEDLFVENWLQRSPLHLAVIFLESSLECLPQNMITKYISTQDLHGCTPLHLAHLHHNEQAAVFLKSHGAKEVTDKFGMSPKSLESSDTAKADVEYKELCSHVSEAKAGVLEKLRPLLFFSEGETEALNKDVETLFEVLLKATPFANACVVICGSMREKLKAGRLDEADVQLRFKGYVDINELLACLLQRLAEISWEGIDLRPISVHGPWKFLRETGTVSLDVVAIIVYDNEGEMKKEDQDYGYIRPDIAREWQGYILGGDLPFHRTMKYCTVETWTNKTLETWTDKRFKFTYFAYEWDIIDSLPASYRLAIVIAKAFVQAYDLVRGDRLRVKMPITSYMIKTAMFHILAYNSGKLHPHNNEALRDALGHVEARSETRTRPKLEYNPQPKWPTAEDVDQHGEEARVWATKIFTFIKCLTQQRDRNAEQGWKLRSYFSRESVVRIENYGEAEYICDVCHSALELLRPNTF